MKKALILFICIIVSLQILAQQTKKEKQVDQFITDWHDAATIILLCQLAIATKL